MKTTNLTEQIEKLVRDHLARAHAEANEAVKRAFASTSPSAAKATRSHGTRAVSHRRDRSVVTELAERLYAEVMAVPGEPMAEYAKKLDASARDLHRPMTLLKRAGRLRTTGARNSTRYFPTPGS